MAYDHNAALQVKSLRRSIFTQLVCFFFSVAAVTSYKKFTFFLVLCQPCKCANEIAVNKTKTFPCKNIALAKLELPETILLEFDDSPKLRTETLVAAQ